MTPHDALRVNVMLPDGYDGQTRFPVLYLLHPYAFGYDYWASPEGGDILNTAADLGAIVVMPEGGRGYYSDWWRGGLRGDPAWEKFHFGELIDEVESRLAVRSGRRWHAIGGFSMGGLGAALGAARRPDYFGSLVELSGLLSLQQPGYESLMDGLAVGFGLLIDPPGSIPENHRDIFGDVSTQEFYWAGHNPLRLVETLRHTRTFMTVGNGIPASLLELAPVGLLASYSEPAMVLGHQQFELAAQQAGVPVTAIYRDGLHSSYSARRGLGEAIDWGLFGEVEESPSSWVYQTVAQDGSMWDLGFHFAEPPVELIRFQRSGSTLSATGSGRVTVTDSAGRTLTADLPFNLQLPIGAGATPGAPPATGVAVKPLKARCKTKRKHRRHGKRRCRRSPRR